MASALTASVEIIRKPFLARRFGAMDTIRRRSGLILWPGRSTTSCRCNGRKCCCHRCSAAGEGYRPWDGNNSAPSGRTLEFHVLFL